MADEVAGLNGPSVAVLAEVLTTTVDDDAATQAAAHQLARLDLAAFDQLFGCSETLAAYGTYIGEEVAKFAQKLGQLQPFIAVFPQECTGQLAYFWANLTPFSLLGVRVQAQLAAASVQPPGLLDRLLRLGQPPSLGQEWCEASEVLGAVSAEVLVVRADLARRAADPRAAAGHLLRMRRHLADGAADAAVGGAADGASGPDQPLVRPVRRALSRTLRELDERVAARVRIQRALLRLGCPLPPGAPMRPLLPR
jgi:hypothetical protein